MATDIKTPSEDRELAASSEIMAVYVWQWPIRIAHWIIVLSLTVLTVTGFYMHHPFLIATSPKPG